MSAPEQIWAWEYHPASMKDASEGGWYSGDERAPSSATSYTRTDVTNAMVAAAYEKAADAVEDIDGYDEIDGEHPMVTMIRALTPTDAKSALDRLIAEAVKEALEKAEQIARDHIPINGRPLQTRVTATAIADEIAALKGGEA